MFALLVFVSIYISTYFTSIDLAQSLIWILTLISAIIYIAFRTILTDQRNDYHLLVIIPVVVSTIIQFGYSTNLNFIPLIFLTVAIIYFCFPLFPASISVCFLILLSLIQIWMSGEEVSFLIWIPVAAMMWGIMFWSLRREREIFRNRFTSIRNRAKDLMSTSKLAHDDQDLPDLDEETHMVKAAASAFKIESIVGWLLQLINHVMHPYSCFFFFLDRDSGNLKIMSAISKSKFFDENAQFNINSEGILAWVVRQKQKIRYERLPKENQNPEYYSARERVLSCLVLPVMNQENVEGVIGVDSKRSHSFDADEEYILRISANLISDVVGAFRNYQQKEYQAVYMEAFYNATKKILESRLDLEKRMDLLLHISQVIKSCEDIAIAILEDDGSYTFRKTIGSYFSKFNNTKIHEHSLVADMLIKSSEVRIIHADIIQTAKNGVIRSDEPTMRFRSMIVVPMPMEDQVMGVLILASIRADFFVEDDHYIFGTLAAQFGFAIENAINIQTIERLAIRDGLTDVYNHRFFQDSLQNEIKRAERTSEQFSLLMIDIDYFKKFNDTYGHQAGDAVLKEIAKLLKDYGRDIDIVARYGGEEFTVILVNCPLKMAYKTADRIRKSCAKRKFKIGDEILSVTMSIGVATYPSHGETSEELIAMADHALYDAKSSGRNRVVNSEIQR